SWPPWRSASLDETDDGLCGSQGSPSPLRGGWGGGLVPATAEALRLAPRHSEGPPATHRNDRCGAPTLDATAMSADRRLPLPPSSSDGSLYRRFGLLRGPAGDRNRWRSTCASR